ncbi:MAG: sugar isomerase domain-containing protein [Allobaculum sp.]
MKRYTEFAQIVNRQIDEALKQEETMDTIAKWFTECIMNDGVIHVFGCGHSQMFGEELCFRTGGLVPINAIMVPQYNIYPKVKLSQIMERQEGVAKAVLKTQNPKPQDIMMIVSVSGRNAAGIDMALAAKEMGMKVVAVTSLQYSNNVISRHSSKKMLKDVSDIVLDICGIKGDSVLEDPRVSEKFCSPSTVVAMTLLVGIVGQTIQNLAEQGINPPIWVSGNLDRGDQINDEFIRQYRDRIDIL